MEFTFENLLATNLINFIIVIATLVLIFKKAHLGDIIQKLADDVQKDIEKSATTAADALKEYKETKKATKDTPSQQAKIIENAKVSARLLKEKIEKQAKTQEEEIKVGVERVFKNQNEKAKKFTVKEIYLACIDLAQEQVINKLNNDTHKKLIDSSINELDKIEGRLS